jgi:membrane fusion protein (multidrug efflux system)
MPDLYVLKKRCFSSDMILLEGVQKVKEGDKIKCKTMDPKIVIEHLRLKAE